MATEAEGESSKLHPTLHRCTSSVIRDGAVAGALPGTEAFAVHYPGYPTSTARAIETLGGLAEISKARSSDKNDLQLRFRPEDPFCHPASGELRPCAVLLLRFSKSSASGGDRGESSSMSSSEKGAAVEEQLSAQIVARVNQAYHFEGMVDYQHVVPVHAAEARKKKRRCEEGEEPLPCDSALEDVMMILPPLFSPKDMPEKIVLNPPPNLFSKSIQRGVVHHSWEMDIEPCLAIDFNIEKIPIKIDWEDKIPKDTAEWECQMAVSKLFDERPIWPRWSLHERLLDDGIEVTESHLKRLLFRTGYYFSTGPFGRFWIVKGYDPRKDPESRIYQRVDFRMPPQLRTMENSKLKNAWKDICRFQVFPSKRFVCLQFFELDDDFIQQEIRKSTILTTCTHLTGWLSTHMLKVLMLRVKIRFLSKYPEGGAESLLKSSRESFERAKKQEALSRFWGPEKEDHHVNRDPDSSDDAPCMESNQMESDHENQEGPNNFELEEEEEDEIEMVEEEEEDEYEAPAMADEDGGPCLDANSYEIGDGISGDYLQELLQGFPFSKDGKDGQANNGVEDANKSDGEYEIYEQDSEGNDDYFDDEDAFP